MVPFISMREKLYLQCVFIYGINDTKAEFDFLEESYDKSV